MISIKRRRHPASSDDSNNRSDEDIVASKNMTDKQVSHVLLTLLLGGIVISFSNSALNPAIPVFMSVFAVDIVMGSWVLNAYVLAMSVGLMLSGYFNKALAFNVLYTLAILGFMVGSMLGILASSMTLVIVARAIQGLSGGLIIPLSIGMLYRMYPQHKHGRVMALWGIVIMLSLALGPLIGAYLVERFAWWTLFAVALPLSAVVVVMAWLLLPKIDSQAGAHPSFDIVGFVSLLAWLLTLVTWLTMRQADQDSLISIVKNGSLAALFLITFGLWWAYERRLSQPLLNVRLFDNPVYLHSTIIGITQTLSLMAGLLLLPIIVQEVMGERALWTGIILMCATLVSSLTTHFAGKRVDRHGASGIGVVGISISALSMLMLAGSLYQPTLWVLLCLMSLQGVGAGLSYLPTATVGFSSLAKDAVTEGAALSNISRRIVSIISITLVSVYVASRGAQLLTVGSSQATAIQEVFVILALVLLLTIPSAYRLPKTAPH